MRIQNAVPAAGPLGAAAPGGTARVRFTSGREIVLEGAGGLIKARLAFSCLVQPQEGDQVLCVPGDDSELHVVAILERPGSQALTLAFPAAASVQADEGSLAISTAQSLTLAAGEGLACVSDHAYHRSREAVLDFDRATARGQALQAHFEAITVMGRTCLTLVRDLVQKVRTYVRQAEDLDQVEGARLVRRARGLYSLGSEYTVLASSRDTKIDGERIHMG